MSKNFDLNTFTYKGLELRMVEIDDAPWFLAVDVCVALGLSKKNVTYYVKSTLESHEIKQLQRDSLDGPESLRAINGFSTGLNLVSESGLYKIALRAQRKNPAARDFQDWVTKEVLPRIRRDGAYIMGEEKVETGEMTEDGKHPLKP